MLNSLLCCPSIPGEDRGAPSEVIPLLCHRYVIWQKICVLLSYPGYHLLSLAIPTYLG